jgi:hypothetical protein
MDWGFVAEDADAYQVLASSVERDVRTGAVLIHGPTGDTWSNLATRVRFGQDDAAAGVQEVRAWFAVRSVEEFRWLVGPSATPPDLISALVSLGASPDEAEPELTAMVLDHAPPLVPNVAVREVGSQSDFEQMERIRRVVFADASTPSPEELRTGWAALSGSEGSKAFLAELDGEAVSYGVMRRTDRGPWLLAGGVTLPRARSRGAYRALVRVRWEAAVAMGAPALVTQAQGASRPILERIGFRTAGSIAVLVDHTRTAATPPR